MSKSAQISLNDDDLREQVEELLGRWVHDQAWKRASFDARAKLTSLRHRHPNVDYYDDGYLVILAAEIVQQYEETAKINAFSALMMNAKACE